MSVEINYSTCRRLTRVYTGQGEIQVMSGSFALIGSREVIDAGSTYAGYDIFPISCDQMLYSSALHGKGYHSANVKARFMFGLV